MKSKSFDHGQNTLAKAKQNKTFDFTNYYKTEAETSKLLENSKKTDNVNKENLFISKYKNDNIGPECSSNKKKSKLVPFDISQIDIEGSTLDTSSAMISPHNDSKTTSTPQTVTKNNKISKMKSIIKNSSYNEDTKEDIRNFSTPGKPKKRNKSVSFMLDETEQVVVKKSKASESVSNKNYSHMSVDTPKNKLKKNKRFKKSLGEKDVKTNTNKKNEVKEDCSTVTEKANQSAPDSKNMPNGIVDKKEAIQKRKKLKKKKKQNSNDNSEVHLKNNNVDITGDNQHKKATKKKAMHKSLRADNAEDEPALKSRKKEDKSDAIVENLENLSIGENAHTLTNLLDDMSVTAKNKRKKNKRKMKKERQDKEQKQTPSTSSSDNTELEIVDENGKEKIKWNRKWNKDKKGNAENYGIDHSVIVDNLPISMICTYKKELANHFSKYGLIRKVGVAEVYPSQESKPVFTTTVHFYSDGAASEALAEDECAVGGAPVRVRRALELPHTTLVVRARGVTPHDVSSMFSPAGRIRDINVLVKGKKALATAFVLFDGPEAVERALAMSQGLTRNGKKVYAARYDLRRKREPPTAADTGDDGDSEHSNE